MATLIRKFRYGDQEKLDQLLNRLIEVIGAGSVFLGAIEDAEFFIHVTEDNMLHFTLAMLEEQPAGADQLKDKYKILSTMGLMLGEAKLEETKTE